MVENNEEESIEESIEEAPTSEREFDLFDTPLTRDIERRAPEFDWLGI